MVITIDMSGDIPIYQQIRDQIVFGVASGMLKTGEQLPTIRQLAADIGVNPMTVSKAYTLLKEEGVIVMDRRHGAQINRLQIHENALDADFDQKAKLLISEAFMKGASQEELKERILYHINSIHKQKEVLP